LPKSTVRILVVEDFEAWRRFVSATLGKRPEFEIVGEVSNGLEAVEKAQELRPDLILMDIGLPKLNGIEAARRILHRAPQSNILFLSENRSRDIAEEALCTGARGYVLKSDAGSELLPALEAVLQGKVFVSANLTEHDSSEPSNGKRPASLREGSFRR
jgi:DNA-binding NarL/FixJ family response regulator